LKTKVIRRSSPWSQEENIAKVAGATSSRNLPVPSIIREGVSVAVIVAGSSTPLE